MKDNFTKYAEAAGDFVKMMYCCTKILLHRSNTDFSAGIVFLQLSFMFYKMAANSST